MNLKSLNEFYKKNGAVLVKNFLNTENLELVKSAISFCEEKPSPFSSKISNKKNKNKKDSTFFHDYWTYKRNNFLQKLLKDKNIIEKIKEISGNKNVRFFHDHILVKQPAAPSTPWHHDRPYYFIDGPNNFSIWITTSEVSEENSLAFCSGSHKSKKVYVPINFDDVSELSNDTSLATLDSDALKKESENGILIFNMSPGDAIFFHNKTLHRSLPTSLKHTRSALSLRMVGDDAFLTKICCTNPQPPFHKFGMNLEEGGKIDDEWFPNLPL
tara:strand:+ start:62 stop:874 length:813 start_codon:yes stop_codon:yes gene_type:complete